MARASGNLWKGKFTASIDGTYLIERKSRILASTGLAPTKSVPSAAWLTYRCAGSTPLRSTMQGPWSGTLTQILPGGYKDAVLPGVANGTVVPPNWNPNVKAWITYNLMLTYTGIRIWRSLAASKPAQHRSAVQRCIRSEHGCW